MKQFFSFVKKEFYHILRDNQTLFILVGMPIVQIILFGFALTNEVKNSKIAVLDMSKDEVTAQIINKLNASRYFEVDKTIYYYTSVEKIFKQGSIKMAVIFPAHFAEDLRHLNKASVQFIADATDPNVANQLTNYASAIIFDYQTLLNKTQQIPYTIHTEVRMLYNPELNSSYSFVPGLMAMVLLLVCTMMTSIAIVKEKELGTMEVILVSPLKPFNVVLAKAVPYLILSMINVASILLLSVFVLDVPIRGSLLLLLAESTLFTITCLSLGLLISTITESQQAAMLGSMMGMFLPTILFSGFMFPIENMPVPLQIISNIVPSKWFYNIVKAIMIKGVGFTAVWKETLILLGMTTLLLSISIAKFKIRLA